MAYCCVSDRQIQSVPSIILIILIILILILILLLFSPILFSVFFFLENQMVYTS